MSAALIEALLVKYGPTAIDFITGLIAKIEAKGDISSAEWATLTASLAMTAQDKMIAQLKAHNVDLNSPLAISLIAAAQ